MKNFDVYFEIYDKKMKTVILAENENDAKNKLKDKITFYKVEASKDDFNKIINTMDDFLNGFSKMK